MPSCSVMPLPAQSTAKPLNSRHKTKLSARYCLLFRATLAPPNLAPGALLPCQWLSQHMALTRAFFIWGAQNSLRAFTKEGAQPREQDRRCSRSRELKAEKAPKQLAAEQLYSSIYVIRALQEPNCQNHNRCKVMQIHQELIWLFIMAAVAAWAHCFPS